MFIIVYEGRTGIRIVHSKQTIGVQAVNGRCTCTNKVCSLCDVIRTSSSSSLSFVHLHRATVDPRSHQCHLPVVVVCCQTISYKCILADHLNEERGLSTLILHCSIPLIFADQAREREFYLANLRIPSMHSIFNWCSLFIAWLILFFMIRYVIQIKLQKRPRCYLEWSAVGLQQTSHTCV